MASCPGTVGEVVCVLVILASSSPWPLIPGTVEEVVQVLVLLANYSPTGPTLSGLPPEILDLPHSQKTHFYPIFRHKNTILPLVSAFFSLGGGLREI